MIYSWDFWLFVYKTIASTSKDVTSWWVFTHELKHFLISLLNRKSLYKKSWTMMWRNVCHDLEGLILISEPSRPNHTNMFLMILLMRLFFILINYGTLSKANYKEFWYFTILKVFYSVGTTKIIKHNQLKINYPSLRLFYQNHKKPGTSFQSSR